MSGSPTGLGVLDHEQRYRKLWNDITLRNVLEFCIGVYAVGLLPMVMDALVHLFPAKSSDAGWATAEGYLFIMVVSAAAFGAGWRGRRQNDNTLMSCIALFSGLGTIGGAFCYAVLRIHPTNLAPLVWWLEILVWWIVSLVAILFLLIKLPSLREEAAIEARKRAPKPRKRAKGI